MSDLRTRWRLVAIVESAGVVRSGLDVELVVDTAAPMVVEAIERAARANGIRLERVNEPAPGPATSPARAPSSRRKRSELAGEPNEPEEEF